MFTSGGADYIFLVVCEFRKLQFFCVCLNVPFEHLGGGMLLQLLAQICIYLIYFAVKSSQSKNILKVCFIKFKFPRVTEINSDFCGGRMVS